MDPKFTKEDMAKLRAFIDAGGMIFSTADGEQRRVHHAIKKYAAEVVNDKYEMRTVAEESRTFQPAVGGGSAQSAAAVGDEQRHSRDLDSFAAGRGGRLADAAHCDNKTSFELAAAVYLYASGMGSLRSKLAAAGGRGRGGDARRARSTWRGWITAATAIRSPGPGRGWPSWRKADFKTQVNLTTVKFAELDPKKYPAGPSHRDHAGHLVTARTQGAQGLSQRRRAAVHGRGRRQHRFRGLVRGSSSSRFIRRAGLEPLPPDHPILTGTMPDGAKFAEAEFRKYGNLLLRRRVTVPELEAGDGGRARADAVLAVGHLQRVSGDQHVGDRRLCSVDGAGAGAEYPAFCAATAGRGGGGGAQGGDEIATNNRMACRQQTRNSTDGDAETRR